MKNTIKNLILVSVTSLTVPALAAIAPASKVPTEVSALSARIKECTYWRSEDVYKSKARAVEIKKALTKLNCTKLETDERVALKKYKDNKSATAALVDARKASVK